MATQMHNLLKTKAMHGFFLIDGYLMIPEVEAATVKDSLSVRYDQNRRQPGQKILAEVGMMKKRLLFDRCLTGDLQPTTNRASKSPYFNELGGSILFDGCLTGNCVGRGPASREFFQYQSPRPLTEINVELAEVGKRIMELLREVTE